MHTDNYIVRCKIIILIISYSILEIESVFVKNDYLVNSEKCKIPSYEPFNEETLPLWYHTEYKSCSSKPILTYITKTESIATLHIKTELLRLYGENVTCCVSNIIRDTPEKFPDDSIRLTHCHIFYDHIALTAADVSVRCHNDLGLEVYRNVHSAILKKPNGETPSKVILTHRPISVLFVVIDSVSRLNLIRTMPETRNYLLENDFIEMQGYNKIDDNTFPNFQALLTGLNKEKLRKINCTGNGVNDLNNCPMIWYKFRELGYNTAYAEDWAYLGTFNYFSKGFKDPPTSYYFRPYVIASEMIGISRVDNSPYCAGPETSGERQLNLASDFAKTFKNSPYFGIFWMNTFSHEAINGPERFDSKLRLFFTDLKAEGVLDDAIVIFLSDHGIRLDPPIRRTLPGWFEERLPMNLISLPKWFREKYPEKHKNLKSNSKKLTSTYDLHMTLQDVLRMSVDSYQIVPSQSCPTCGSLFDVVQADRSCKEAGIPSVWCTCNGYLIPLNITESLPTKATQFVLDIMRSQLESANITHLCENLELLVIQRAGRFELSDRQGRPANLPDEGTLFLNFVTTSLSDYIVLVSYKHGKNEDITIKRIDNLIKLSRENNICLRHANASKFSRFCRCKMENRMRFNEYVKQNETSVKVENKSSPKRIP